MELLFITFLSIKSPHPVTPSPISLALQPRSSLPELKSLGNSYSKSVEAACNLSTARCDHEKRKSAAGCLEEVIGEKKYRALLFCYSRHLSSNKVLRG
ncbi:Protein of unknown function DUF652 [Macleaya cordata]|uniref:Uncharacterized protein n=1 Tax=Macleaya cordata TaxID=56857 RepID=A0A200QW38_MACCD|nr:Protein of unknown function DUF652 [Macleaya cordata]